MTMAKALSSGYLPIGGLMVGDRVAEVLIDKGGEFFHGFTYSGHPVACAVAIANLEILRRRAHRRARARRCRPLSSSAAGTSWRLIRWSAKRAAWACWRARAGADKSPRRFFEPRGEVGLRMRDNCIAQRSGHARDARHAVRRAAFGHLAERNRRTTVQSSAIASMKPLLKRGPSCSLGYMTPLAVI